MSMMFTYPKNCGNSPRMTIMKDYLFASATGDYAYLKEKSMESIIWERVGVSSPNITGIEALVEKLADIPTIQALHIQDIITHGKTAAVHGTVELQQDTYHFCHIFIFASAGKQAKLTKISSYLIPEPKA